MFFAKNFRIYCKFLVRILILIIFTLLMLLFLNPKDKSIFVKSDEMIYFSNLGVLSLPFKSSYTISFNHEVPEYTIVSIADKVYEKISLEFILDSIEYKMDVSLTRPTTSSVLKKMKNNSFGYFYFSKDKGDGFSRIRSEDFMIDMALIKASHQLKWNEFYKLQEYKDIEFVENYFKLILKSLWPKNIPTEYEEVEFTFSNIRKIEKM